MNFFVAYPATLAAKRERLIIFRCVIEKKELPKEKIITTNGVNLIPTTTLPSSALLFVFYCTVETLACRVTA